MPIVVHYWADLQSVHGLPCYGKTVEMRSGNPPGPPHALRMPVKTLLASNKIDAPAVCAISFCPYCGGVVKRTRNVSEYMLVLGVCLVGSIVYSSLVMTLCTVLHCVSKNVPPLTCYNLHIHDPVFYRQHCAQRKPAGI